jgi:hypothetical protein
MPMQPHVFVVMPFGAKEAQQGVPATDSTPAKPPVLVDFTEVYNLLIQPALQKAACVPFRADEEAGAGDIRTDMFFELVTADAVLADISLLNANVFYELGVRHGVRPRGVFMIHGGWAKRPFDVAPDRTFDYDGSLFTVRQEARDAAWGQRLKDQADRLATLLRNALEADDQTIGSPVYKELVGLKEADWTKIETAKAKYFGEVFADWKGRVEVARLNGWPGDILTLADDAPTRFHRARLLWIAADALCSMERFQAAHDVLQELLLLDPRNRDALTRLGLVLGRLRKIQEAKSHMLNVVEQYRHDTEAHGIMGRVYKDLWRLEWQGRDSLEERRKQAVVTSSYCAAAISAYDQAARKNFDYYTGINVVSLVKLLQFLQESTGDAPVLPAIKDLDDLTAVVRFAAQNVLDCSTGTESKEAIWAAATLGELDLVAGAGAMGCQHYRQAAIAPATTYFNLNSMLDQVYLFDSLGFRPECLGEVKQLLESRRGELQKRAGAPAQTSRRFDKIVLSSGHMIDQPGRAQERFPARKAEAVRQRIAQQLADWQVGAGDLAICGAARGCDILFAEESLRRGAAVWLFLALPEGDFLEQSVRLPESDWEERFYALRDHASVQSCNQRERLKAPPKGSSVFARNNLWMINTARVEADEPKHLYALLVWDEQPTGDGPGGTSDFAERIRRLGGRLRIINPVTL